MKVIDLEAWLCHFPLEQPFHPSWIPGYTAMMSSCVIYKLKTDEGLEGIAGGPAFADEARGPINLLRTYIIGLDVDDTDEVYSRLQVMHRALGIRSWWLEVAFWDLKGKAHGLPIAKLLGAKRDRVKAYASTGEAREPSEAADHAAAVVERGFKAIKIRPRHHELEQDLAMVKQVRAAIGDGPALMCDANQAWRVDAFAKGPVWDLDRAVTEAKAMEESGVAWLEEPLDMFDLAGYAELRRRTKTPIAAGELHGDPSLVRLLMEAEGVDVVQPDLVHTGGVTGAWSLAQAAAERGLAFSPHTWSHGLGLAANLHLAIAAENCEWLEFPFDPPGWTPEGRDWMLAEPISIDPDGFVHLSDAPGLGVTLDEEKIRAHGAQL